METEQSHFPYRVIDRTKANLSVRHDNNVMFSFARKHPLGLLPLLVYSLLKNSLVDLVEKRAKPCAIVIAILYIIIGLTGLLLDLCYAQVDTTRMTHHRTKGVLFWNSETSVHRPGHCSSFLPCHSILSYPSIHPVSQPFVFYWSACEHLHMLTIKSQ
jgi:uncharacterized membrane protein YuzA (DUF378 family)